MTATFGDIIREWRAVRRFSQLHLSLEANTSARHLSFLESGRANPSRAMVLKLAEALAMPKGVANQALSAAGFANTFPSLPMNADALSPVRDAIALMLANHDPPARRRGRSQLEYSQRKQRRHGAVCRSRRGPNHKSRWRPN